MPANPHKARILCLRSGVFSCRGVKVIRHLPCEEPLDPSAKKFRARRIYFNKSADSRRRQGRRYAAIDDAVRRAARRWVKVRMIVSDWQKGTAAVPALKDLAGTPNIEVAFTAIPDWSGGYVPFVRVKHCKYIVADDTKFWLGTSNCEKSYFYRSRSPGRKASRVCRSRETLPWRRFLCIRCPDVLEEPLPAWLVPPDRCWV